MVPSAPHSSSGLASEIGKRRPFAVREEETFLNILRTQAVLTERVEALFRGEGVSMPLYNILRILTGHAAEAERRGVEPEGLPVSRIALQMLTREPDMTRLIDRLERNGLVVRRRSLEDRRRVHVAATEAGRTLAERLRPDLERLHAEQLGHLSDTEQRALNDLLIRARDPSRTHGSASCEGGETRAQTEEPSDTATVGRETTA